MEDDGLADQLMVSVPVEVRTAGRYRFVAHLESPDGEHVVPGGTTVDLAVGSQRVDVPFSGRGIFDVGKPGPYRVVDAVLIKDDAALSFEDQVADLGTTAAYEPIQFQHFRVEFDLDGFTDRGVDPDGDGLFDSLRATGRVRVDTGGEHHINARLLAPDGTEVAEQQAAVTFSAGWNEFQLDFPGAAIRASGKDGPYEVSDLSAYLVADPSMEGYLITAHRTGSYRPTDFEYDTVPPESEAGPTPTLSSAQTIAIPFSAADATSGVTAVELWARHRAEEASPWDPWAYAGTATSSPIDFAFPAGDGIYELYTVATDGAGNTEQAPAAADVVIRRDTTPPASYAGPLRGVYSRQGLDVPIFFGEDTSGVQQLELWARFRSSLTAPWEPWSLAAFGDASPLRFTFPQGDGHYEFYSTAADGAGNQESAPQTADAATHRDSTANVAPTISSVWPSVAGPGEQVTVVGTNFDGLVAGNTVAFGSVTGTVLHASFTELTVRTPSAGGSGPVGVQTEEGSATTDTDFYAAPSPYVGGDVEHKSRMAVGSTATVTITQPQKIGLLLFQGATDQRISLQVTNSTVAVSYVSILRPDGTTLLNRARMAPNGFADTVTLPVAGTYTIFLDPENANVGSLSLRLYDVPPDPAPTLTPGDPAITLTTTVPGQNARPTFAGAEGQRVSLQATNSTVAVSYVSILKPDGTTLLNRARMAPNGFADTVTLPIAGTYTIFVDPENANTGSLSLRLYDVPPDPAPTLTPGDPAISLGITTPGQNARPTYTGAVGQRVSAEVTNSTVAVSYVSILKPDGTTLLNRARMAPNGFADTVTLPVAGTYTIVMDPENANTGTLSLRLYDVPPDPAPTLVVGGAAVTVTTTVPGHNARPTFQGSGGTTVSLVLSSVTIAQSDVSILKPDGTVLVSPTYVTTSGKTLTATLPTTGTYTVVVNPRSTYTGSMTLRL